MDFFKELHLQNEIFAIKNDMKNDNSNSIIIFVVIMMMTNIIIMSCFVIRG